MQFLLQGSTKCDTLHHVSSSCLWSFLRKFCKYIRLGDDVPGKMQTQVLIDLKCNGCGKMIQQEVCAFWWPGSVKSPFGARWTSHMSKCCSYVQNVGMTLLHNDKILALAFVSAVDAWNSLFGP